MKLCKHIQPIYQNEISNGNSIVYIIERNQYLIVALKNVMSDYQSLPEIKFYMQTDTHYVRTIDYICCECKCSICAPIDMQQLDRHRRDYDVPVFEDVIATSDNIEVSDERWRNMGWAVIPKFVGLIDHYWDDEPPHKLHGKGRLK